MELMAWWFPLPSRGTLTHWKEGTLAGASKIFIELTGMTRARAAAASSCSACELAVRLVSRDCCACRGAATALREQDMPMGGMAGCPSTSTQPCAGSGQAAMVLDSWLPTAAIQGAGDLQARPGRAQGEGSVARRRSAGCQSVGFGRPG